MLQSAAFSGGGSIHLFTSSILEELAKSGDVDPHAVHPVLAAEEMKRCGDTFPFIHKVLHQLFTKARSDSTQLPTDLVGMMTWTSRATEPERLNGIVAGDRDGPLEVRYPFPARDVYRRVLPLVHWAPVRKRAEDVAVPPELVWFVLQRQAALANLVFLPLGASRRLTGWNGDDLMSSSLANIAGQLLIRF
ncbi:uncharacterized protein PG986_014331 [Apiospora aurea]|uniref:Uncharacterized protein n=1 Tax=Apiospora aurea TaxID=335848 RepID=A0ABR1PT00_9PEZI